jgi:hypothetical protein
MLIKVILLLSLIYITDLAEGQKANRECCEDYCFDTDTERKQIIHFSTKTAYQKVKGIESDHTVQGKLESTIFNKIRNQKSFFTVRLHACQILAFKSTWNQAAKQ